MLSHQHRAPATARGPEAKQHDAAHLPTVGTGTIGAMAGVSFTSKWYSNPERLMSPNERLPG